MFLNDMEFGFDETEATPSKINRKGWAQVVAAGIAAVGALASSAGSDNGGSGAVKPKILPKTESGVTSSDMDFLFDEGAEAALDALTEQLGDWAADDQNFFQNVYQPFQNELMDTNASMLPVIERTSADAMETISRDMVSNESMKSALRNSISTGRENMGSVMNSFMTELDNLPTEEERVAQAFTNIEGQFGQAGKELSRKMAEQGRAVSQSSARNMAIEKAKAKAGAAGVARQGARAERREALTSGLGAVSAVTGQDTQSLLGVEGVSQRASELGLQATGAQVGGVTQAQGGAQMSGVQADLVGQAAQKVLGTDAVNKSTSFVQKGIKNPAAAGIDPETGEFSDEWKAAKAQELADKRAHELAMARAKARRTGGSGGVRGRSGGPGVGGADSDATGGVDGGVGTGGSGGSSPGGGMGPAGTPGAAGMA